MSSAAPFLAAVMWHINSLTGGVFDDMIIAALVLRYQIEGEEGKK